MTSPCGVALPEESSPLVVPGVGSPRPRRSQLSLDAPPPDVLSLFASFASHSRRHSLMTSSYALAPDGRLGHGVLCLQGPIPEQIEVDPCRDFCAGRCPLVLQVDGVRLHTFSLQAVDEGPNIMFL